jgi:NAD-dependent dihydropyrimidine dehydrogenase PreA subunit
MIKQKAFSRLNQRNQTMLLPNLTDFETHSTVQSNRRPVKKGALDKSRGLVEIERDLCKGCLLCIEACPPAVLVVSKSLNKMGYHPAEYIGEKCTACGACFYICPEPGSIRVFKKRSEKRKSEEKI